MVPQFDIKGIIESGRADNLLYVYDQLRKVRVDFISRTKEKSSIYYHNLSYLEDIIQPRDEVQAMVREELAIDKDSPDYPFIPVFFSDMLVSDILIEAGMNYPHKLKEPTRNPNTDRLLDIIEEELRDYMSTWCTELIERKTDD